MTNGLAESCDDRIRGGFERERGARVLSAVRDRTRPPGGMVVAGGSELLVSNRPTTALPCTHVAQVATWPPAAR